MILGPNGQPIRSSSFARSKEPTPIVGEAFGSWAGRDVQVMHLPGGGVVQFDLSRLTLADFRTMTHHYQVNSSLMLLTFMMHQMDYTIEASSQKVRAHVEANLERIWSRLVRALSQSFWAGYSPNILQWENENSRVWVTKIKDLMPEEAAVNWKEVEGKLPPTAPSGAIPPKLKIYDGIKQHGTVYPVPSQNTLWYPLLMENGNYQGKKLLKSAFQPWFFSQLIHLFSNRYFERFGEPLPIGRAPFDDQLSDAKGNEVRSQDYMAQVLQGIRSRAVSVLPSDRSTEGGSPSYDYTVEYLESQMRGADFERYMTRLDEEISLALFTPILLVRTGDVGSYSLGATHNQIYQWQLNALAGDWREYVNRYLIAPIARYNFGDNTWARLKFRKIGVVQAETLRAILGDLTRNGRVQYDYEELGQAAGLSIDEIKEVTEPVQEPEQPTRGDGTQEDNRDGRIRDDKGSEAVADKVTQRIAGQAMKAYRSGAWDTWRPDIGFSSQLSERQSILLNAWTGEVLSAQVFDQPQQFVEAFNKVAQAVLV